MDEPLDMGSCILVLLYICRRSLVLCRPQQNGLHHVLVFICLPKYGTNNVNFRHRQGLQLQSDSDHRLSHDTDSDPYLVLRCWDDGPGYQIETDSLAPKGRRQRRRWLQSPETEQRYERLIALPVVM